MSPDAESEPLDRAAPDSPHNTYAIDDERPDGDYELQETGEYNSHEPLRPSQLKGVCGAGVLEKCITWINGPHPPRTFKIKPWIRGHPRQPDKVLQRYRLKAWHAFAALGSLWLLTFCGILVWSATSCTVEHHGDPLRLSCVSRLWRDGPSCGLDGKQCEPFTNYTLAFRCPANCQQAKMWSPYTVGAHDVQYKTLVVGTRDPMASDEDAFYRGDSFICAAALHAGLVSNRFGGTGVLTLTGKHRGFLSTSRHDVSSTSFAPEFPQSFQFSSDYSAARLGCFDPRWFLLVVSLVSTMTLSLSTDSAPRFYWTSFCMVFLTVALGTDPPDEDAFNAVLASAFRRLLPAMFVGLAIYHYASSTTLVKLTARFEKTLFWLGACWIGALDNYTFDTIPIQRLTPHDLRSQPGAVTALIILILSLVVAALGQAWALRIEGRLLSYLKLYGLFGGVLLLLLLIPSLNLRIHHYILALLLLPGTAIQTRPSLLFQGLLVGLFINGVARWGFAGILETDALLFTSGSGEGPKPTMPLPQINGNLITFDWDNTTFGRDSTTRLSMLVNDVERFRSHLGTPASGNSMNWTRRDDRELTFFRMAFVHTIGLGRDLVGDYTKPGTWFPNGTWASPAQLAD